MQVTKDNYQQVYIEKKKQLIEYVHNNDNWKLEKNKEDVQIYRAKTDDNSHLVRAVGLVSGSVKAIIEQIFDVVNTAKPLDPDVSSSKILETLDPHNQIVYQKNRMPSPVTKREFVSYQGYELVSDTLAYYIVTSTEHVSAPNDRKYVRGEIILGGYIIEKADEHNCTVNYVLRVDLKGMLPSFAVSAAATEQGLHIRHLREWMAKRV